MADKATPKTVDLNSETPIGITPTQCAALRALLTPGEDATKGYNSHKKFFTDKGFVELVDDGKDGDGNTKTKVTLSKNGRFNIKLHEERLQSWIDFVVREDKGHDWTGLTGLILEPEAMRYGVSQTKSMLKSLLARHPNGVKALTEEEVKANEAKTNTEAKLARYEAMKADALADGDEELAASMDQKIEALIITA